MNKQLKDEINKRIATGGLATDIDLHVHTTFSDGISEAEDVVLSAIDKGIKILGFSDHSLIPGEPWCMTGQLESEYRRVITALKEKYNNKIQIYCGIEQDVLSGKADPFYDYVIGSAHAVKAGDGVLWVDESLEAVQKVVERYYDGDIYSYSEAYYAGVEKVYEITGCDIVGHFDLLAKFNEGDKLFSSSHPRYIKAWKQAADALLGHNLIFEINTGAISRGYRSAPYPSEEILEYLKNNHAKLMLNSDSHDRNTLAYEFDKWEKCYGHREDIC